MAKTGRLSVKEVENARSWDGKDRWLSDGGGLYLHVRPSGTKAWRMRYMLAGRSRVLDLGSADLKTLAEARREALDLRKLLDAGTDPVEDAARRAEAERQEEIRRQLELASRRTLDRAVDAWVTHQLASRKDKGAEALRALRKDVIPTLGERELSSIKKGDLIACLDAITARGARRQANASLRELKQFFSWCEAREWVPRSPLIGVKKKHVGGDETVRDRVLSIDEIRQLRDALPVAHLEKHAQLAIWILLSTVARVGELSAAAWEDVDLDAATWFIPETKNSLPHTVFLSDFALAQFRALRELTKWSKWVMPSARKRGEGKQPPALASDEDHPMGSSVLTKQVHDRQNPPGAKNRTQFKEALILPGGRWTPHDLRRTGATLMGENGVLSEIIERCLNHKQPSKLVRTYQHQELVPERRQAWHILGDVLNSIVNEEPRKVVPISAAAR